MPATIIPSPSGPEEKDAIMAKGSMNLQDSFLNQVRKEGLEVKLVLLDGSALLGTVRGFDNFTVILSSKRSQHLIYKHAIAQIINQRAAGGRDEARGDEAPAKERPDAEPREKNSFNTLNLARVVVS